MSCNIPTLDLVSTRILALAPSAAGTLGLYNKEVTGVPLTALLISEEGTSTVHFDGSVACRDIIEFCRGTTNLFVVHKKLVWGRLLCMQRLNGVSKEEREESVFNAATDPVDFFFGDNWATVNDRTALSLAEIAAALRIPKWAHTAEDAGRILLELCRRHRSGT